jgi:hypothetical protein
MKKIRSIASVLAATGLFMSIGINPAAAAFTDRKCHTFTNYNNAEVCVSTVWYPQQDGTGLKVNRLRVWSPTPGKFDAAGITVYYLTVGRQVPGGWEALQDYYGDVVKQNGTVDRSWYPDPDIAVNAEWGKTWLSYRAHLTNSPDPDEQQITVYYGGVIAV